MELLNADEKKGQDVNFFLELSSAFSIALIF